MAGKMKRKVVFSDDEQSDAEEKALDLCFSVLALSPPVYHKKEEKALDYQPGLPTEKLNLGPRKKLLVLSPGGLLCHRILFRKFEVPSHRAPDAQYGSFKVYKRPYCEEFMKFCLERFEVGIWSSAREWYLDNVLDCVMKGLRRKLLFAWGQDKCTDSGFKTLEDNDKPLFLKELKKLWGNIGSLAPYSSSNTLLIDFVPYKALLNPAHTAIFVTEYIVDQVDDMALGPKGELRLYLEGLADADDVTTYVKEHPFGQPAITSSHSDWSYYSKIITHLQKDR